jgi:uncharacterized membrane protein HdeD (DUF308 family)
LLGQSYILFHHPARARLTTSVCKYKRLISFAFSRPSAPFFPIRPPRHIVGAVKLGMEARMSVAGVAEHIAQKTLRDHWKLFLTEGIVLVVLGMAAILIPVLASVVIAVFLGWLFAVGGIVSLIATIMARRAPGFWWSLISALIALLVGLALLSGPVAGAVSITFILTIFLVIDGILMIVFGLEHRKSLSAQWGWLVVNGVVDLVLAGLIVSALPGSAVWALGLIVGIDLLFGGWSLIAVALAARRQSA